jgi:hypothetical protein
LKTIPVLLVFTLLFVSQIFAQVDTAWTRTYGGAQGDFGYYGEPLDDGYVFVGETSSFGAGGKDVYLVKTDVNGDSLWTATFGDSFGQRGNCVIQTQDQGFVIAGYAEYGYDSAKVLLIKADSTGKFIWRQLFHPGGFLDYGYFVQQILDGGFIITGISYPGYIRQDAFLIKTDSLGNEEWAKTYGDDYGDHGYCVRQTNDEGYVVTGIYSADLYGSLGNVYLFKTDKHGNLQWQKDFGGNPTDAGYCVWQTPDGGFILTGETDSYGDSDGDVYLMKTDSLGIQQWTPKYFGGAEWDRGRYLDITSDGCYIIVGRTRSFGDPNGDIYLLKVDTLGTLLWQQTFGGSGIEFGSSVQQTTDGGFFITATTTSFGAGSWEAYILKTNPEAGVVEEDRKPKYGIGNVRLVCNPVPFLEQLTISLLGEPEGGCIGGLELKIYDVVGRRVRDLILYPSSFILETTWDGKDEEGRTARAGTYFISIDGSPKQKVVKIQ